MGSDYAGRNYDPDGTYELKFEDKVISRTELLQSMDLYFRQNF